jgi:hypothetical protein
MFLAWNYTIELFFWIVLGAVILVSLTIFLAGPRFRSKKSETSEETLLLTGESVDSSRENILDQDTASGRVEEELEILEEIEKGETEQDNLPLSVRIKAYAIILAYIFYFLFVGGLGAFFIIAGLPRSVLSVVLDPVPPGGGNVFAVVYGFLLFLSGLGSFYGMLVNRNKLIRDSCRIAAALFLLLGFGWMEQWFLWALVGLIASLSFSGDLKRLWKRILSNERVKAPIVSILDTRLLLFSVILLLTIIVVFF